MSVAAVRRMDIREYDLEPVRGLPERLPKGEEILWQGTCDAAGMARRAFHIRKIAVYFALLLAWYAISSVYDGATVGATALAAGRFVLMALVVLGLIGLFGWLTARTTVYTVTNHRVVIRYGIAFPMIVNIPFKIVESADLRSYADGTGDIVLTLSAAAGTSYIMMWPHVRPWRLARVQPMLRCVKDGSRVAKILAQALAAAITPGPRVRTATGAARGADARPPATAAA